VGLDILPVQVDWPLDPRVKYVRANQASRQEICDVFISLANTYCLMIEDGSHHPQHQVNSILEGVKCVKSGGCYVVEDIHTSKRNLMEMNILDSRVLKWNHRRKSKHQVVNLYSFLLALEHNLRTCSTNFSAWVEQLNDENSLISKVDAESLVMKISEVKFYNRNTLPTKCHNCDESIFDYTSIRCMCGVEIFSSYDSISAFVYIK
jgi:hypothetical protein